MSRRKKLIKIMIPILIVIVSFIVMRVLIFARPAPRKEVREDLGALVEVMTVKKIDHRIRIAATGTVQAGREIAITPQVDGRLSYIAPQFVAGGFFSKGDILFRIERIDYELAVERAKAALAQAELELAREESNARIARQEWELLGTNGNDDPNPLVLYEPQLRRAQANIASARAALRQAEIDLQRTSIRAPFNCRVRTETVDIGQYVRAGVGVGTIAGTDRAEIVVPLSLEDLRRLKIPRQGDRKQGSDATVKISSGKRVFTWKGYITRSLGEVDVQGRMTRVVVAVDDPYHLKTKRRNGKPDLEVGLFVDVVLRGEMLPNVIPLPRKALRENETVWIEGDRNTLHIRPVTVEWREKDTVLVKNGLNEGDGVVLTRVPGAAEGMKIRPLDKERAP